MANITNSNPMTVDTVSTATTPLVAPGSIVSLSRIQVSGTGAGERFTLRHNAMSGDGTIIYDFVSSATKLSDTMPLPHGPSYSDGLYVSSIGGTQTARIWK